MQYRKCLKVIVKYHLVLFAVRLPLQLGLLLRLSKVSYALILYVALKKGKVRLIVVGDVPSSSGKSILQTVTTCVIPFCNSCDCIGIESLFLLQSSWLKSIVRCKMRKLHAMALMKESICTFRVIPQASLWALADCIYYKRAKQQIIWRT